VAGNQVGLDGERSGLWSEIVRLSRELRPKFVIVENVAALLDLGFSRVLADLAEIGFDAEWHCIPASAVGAPHRRDRVWIIAYPQCEGREGLEPIWRTFERSPSPFPEYSNPFSVAWRVMDGDIRDIRERDGLSVAMERRRLHALGNAVVPQIPEMIGRAILASQSTITPAE
jgi:DNA (cytosine-5)-methyltransferase 1